MLRRHRSHLRPGLAVFAGLFWACGMSDPACTLIGCESGLIVRVSGLPEGMATITLQVAGQEPIIRACPSSALCEQIGVQFTDQTPVSATVVVTSGNFSKSFTVTDPVYEDHQPNGEDCPPVCRTAVVTLDGKTG